MSTLSLASSFVILGISLIQAPEQKVNRALVVLDRIVATINDDAITLNQLKEAAKPYAAGKDISSDPNFYRNVLNKMVEEQLLEQQIQTEDITVSDADIDRAIANILQQNNLGPDQLEIALRNQGMTLAAYRKSLRKQLRHLKLIELKVRSQVSVTEDDVRAEYDVRTKDEPAVVKVELAHIWLQYDAESPEEDQQQVKTMADEVRKRVTEGQENFADVAKELSEGPTADKGGDLGLLILKDLVPQKLANAVAKLEPGQISQPVKTDKGIHIVLLKNKQVEKSTPFDSLKRKIYQELTNKRVETRTVTWLEELRRNANVEIKL